MMQNMTNYNYGDVVLVPFPFTDQTTTKKRPSVIVSLFQKKPLALSVPR
jgi:mRNA interferase MazF